MAEKRKMTVIFLIVMVIISIFLFLPDEEPETTLPAADPPVKESEETIETEEVPEVSEIEKERADEINKNTTFWMWEGKESGKDSAEYITLRGDDIYILRIELEDHEPMEEQGIYKWKNSEKTEAAIPYKGDYCNATIDGNKLIIEEKTFKKLENSHF